MDLMMELLLLLCCFVKADLQLFISDSLLILFLHTRELGQTNYAIHRDINIIKFLVISKGQETSYTPDVFRFFVNCTKAEGGSPVGTGSHFAIMALQSWPLGHTQRKEPSMFTHWASPHTLLSSSHSFTSVEKEQKNNKCIFNQFGHQTLKN